MFIQSYFNKYFHLMFDLNVLSGINLNQATRFKVFLMFKLLTLAQKCKHDQTSPLYIQNLLKPHNYSYANILLRSHADDNFFACNKTYNTYGDKAFCNAVLSGINYLNYYVFLTVLQLLNLIWKHIYFQNDNDSVNFKLVIKLYIYMFKLKCIFYLRGHNWMLLAHRQ